MAPTTRSTRLKTPAPSNAVALQSIDATSKRPQRTGRIQKNSKLPTETASSSLASAASNIKKTSGRIQKTNKLPTKTASSSLASAASSIKTTNPKVRLVQMNLDQYAIRTSFNKKITKEAANKTTVVRPASKKVSKEIPLEQKTNIPAIKLTECYVSLERLANLPNQSKPDKAQSEIQPKPKKPAPLVPIYKSKLQSATAGAPSVDNQFALDEESNVYDYFSNSQENPDDLDENKQVINKLKKENKITIVKKKPIGVRKKPDTKGAKLMNARAKYIQTKALKGLKASLIEAIQFKQKNTCPPIRKPVMSTSPTYERPITNPIVFDCLDNTLELSIIPIANSSAINSDSPAAHASTSSNQTNLPSRLALRKPSHQSTPILSKPASSTHIKLPPRLALLKPSHQSTPIRSKPAPSGNQLAPKSPWRVSEENIPRAQYYAVSSRENLPSYSSDIIQVAEQVSVDPKKNVPRKRTVAAAAPDPPNVLAAISPIDNVSTGSMPQVEFDEMRSVSNIENVAPELSRNKGKPSDRQVVILGERNLNTFRSPLKPLSIRNVLLSPPQKSRSQIHRQTVYSSGSSGESVDRNSSVLVSDETPLKKVLVKRAPTSENTHDFFGFDTQDDSSEENDIRVVEPKKHDLLSKMEHLKRLLPGAPREPTHVRSIPRHQTLFESCQPKQATVKNAFAAANTELSTSPMKDVATIKLSRSTVDDTFDCVRLGVDSSMEDCPALFETLWPEKEKPSRRSYTRVPKRKHYVESSFTDDEEEEQEDIERARRKRPKTVKQRTAEAAAADLEMFADEFNSMCEMVEQYELVVEKSA